MKNKILNIIEIIKESGKLIIVEGKNDKKALNELGLKNIITLSKEPLFSIVEQIDDKEVIILTDFDKEGKKLYQSLKHDLQEKGVKIDDKLRRILSKSKITHIEGLTKYLNKT